MPFCCFTGSTGETLRKIQDAFERKMSATEMVDSGSSRSFGVAKPVKPPSVIEPGGNEYHAASPLVSSNSIPIYYDKDYLPPPPKKTLRYRYDPDCTVSVLTETSEPFTKRPTASDYIADLPKFSGSRPKESPTGTVLHHPVLLDGFQSASDLSDISPPLTRYPLYAQRPGPDRKPSLTFQDSSIHLHQKCSKLYEEREVLASHFDSAMHDLSNARQQLQSAKDALAAREDDVRRLGAQAVGLKKGMELAMLHYQAMARELSDMKKEHAACSLQIRSRYSFPNCFRRATRSRVRQLEKILDKAEFKVQLIQQQWSSTHLTLMRTEAVLREQRERMKVKIRALQHTQDELVGVRKKLRVLERVLEDEKKSIEVLRQNNRDLALEIKFLRHGKMHGPARNFTV